MNKRVLKRYLNYKYNNREILRTSCFEFDNGYIISDSYSVIKLNETNDLKVEKDIMGVCKFYDDFNNNYELDFELKDIEIIEYRNKKFAIGKLNDSYCINVPLFNKIKTIINANKFSILKNKDTTNEAPIIKVENTDTNEVGYMLPMRKF